ncbi:uncharacterized protein N7484_000366 [Penicillium longicatenatum]|uniref:uncharacterized protein n=1 Tax=Penicillium longicatenatum TaxID=1561947 RepID=UPI00254828EE|nr:uncharacterized protein N7484_000366 [Penicillium longicatenatum]KAJ5660994.1 hypothetical protein N7484_000366 [Penicillium longicatenatum]
MFHPAVLVQKSMTEHGSYRVAQLENSEVTSPLSGSKNKSRVYFDTSVDIFRVFGSTDTQNHDTELELEVYGMSLGLFRGTPNRMFKINLDLKLVKGTIDFRINGFDELWLDIDTKILQVTEKGPGEWTGCRKAHLITCLPALQCDAWLAVDAHI